MKVNLFGRRFLITFTVFWTLGLIFSAQNLYAARVRKEVNIPEIHGYVTLKCDFHLHTVFSDGKVWPTIRAEEAWREGLDAFAITDHIEHKPHSDDVNEDHNRSYELAQPSAKTLGLKVIRGAEITRSMPPGHINAIFLKDVRPLDTEKWEDAIKIANQQKAFVFWNHPGWFGQQPDNKSVWYQEHTQLYKKGWLHGIEIVNGKHYFPLAHKWCLEKKLTMMGNSDSHNPTNLDYDFHNDEHRVMTLVLAKSKTKEAIKEALFARRTIIYWENKLIGEEKYLRPIFDKSIEIINPAVEIEGRRKRKTFIQIRNKSEIDFELVANGKIDNISVPRKIILYGDKTILLWIRVKQDTPPGTKQIRIPYKVKNLLTGFEKNLAVEWIIDVDFISAKQK